ncbi:exosortase Y-associated Wzy-like protein [Mucilaginibacter sp.]|uniref:exosortase Y-associated Wzy-like protein n=1 Tax=Mucilaginibacter sp. TaxID=1882438 RepID=UPI0026391122|nr:hypothetical protein [Mucilaginibacter sp.]MDB4926981.1 hypothetical protein [Mucilaginibacter sp.]
MEETSRSFERYLILYIPWILSIALQGDPIVSYLIAWIGSFFIFYISYSGWIKPLPTDRNIAAQLMRPIFLVQIIFIGYMACSSMFYFLNLLGYEDLNKSILQFSIDNDKLALTAQCQRYYVLGHAAFASGLILSMKYPVKQKYKIDNTKLANVLLIIAVVFLPLSILVINVSGLAQFSHQFSSLSFISGTLALAFAIPLKKVFNTLFCVFLYLSNFYEALTSGFKEPIIISVLVLGIFLYPNYKKIVTFTFVPALLLLFMLLPTYNSIYRANAWGDNVNADDAYKIALDATLNSNQSDDETNWGFLVYRLSEIDMFTAFLQSTPEYVDYYGFDLVKQAGIVVVPRLFWPSKPSTEQLVMERVYTAGVIRRGSNVSAKPAYVVDAYLSGGAFGVFLALFVYGAAVQLISQKAEQLFGGYILGTALIFSGLFQIFWRGSTFEFLLNSVFWSYISMIIIHKILRAYNILQDI